jgi:hypothetical protein
MLPRFWPPVKNEVEASVITGRASTATVAPGAEATLKGGNVRDAPGGDEVELGTTTVPAMELGELAEMLEAELCVDDEIELVPN